MNITQQDNGVLVHPTLGKAEFFQTLVFAAGSWSGYMPYNRGKFHGLYRIEGETLDDLVTNAQSKREYEDSWRLHGNKSA